MRLIQLIEASTLAEYGWHAALLIDGCLWTADTHYDAWYYFVRGKHPELDEDDAQRMVLDEYANRSSDVEGFVDKGGIFYNRYQAMREWRKLRDFKTALNQDRSWADSEDTFIKQSAL